MRAFRRLWLLMLVLSATAAAAVAWMLIAPVAPAIDEQLAAGRAAFLRQDFLTAYQLGSEVLARSPRNTPALLIAAQAAAQLGQGDEALRLLDRLPDDSSPDVMAGRLLAASMQLTRDRVSEAEHTLRRIVARDSNHPTATVELARILAMQGRFWESIPWMAARLRREQFSFELLMWIVQPDAILNDETRPILERWHKAAPNDARSLTGLSRLALKDNDVTTARRLLQQAVTAEPEFAEAQAQLGALLLDSFPHDWLDWNRSLPTSCQDHPEIWVTRGHWARRDGNPRIVARCFLEAVRRDPNHRVANYQAGQSLIALDQRDLAAPFLKRAERLDRLRQVIEQVADDHSQVELLQEAATLTEQLGRYWESWGWHQFTLAVNPRLAAAMTASRRIQSVLTKDLPDTDPQTNPVRTLDVEPFPLPNFGTSPGKPQAVPLADSSDVRFEDSARDCELSFQYVNGHDARHTVMRMMEFIGGGLGVLDFDGDYWPDLYCTQGSDWPNDGQREDSDKLFQNLGDGRFRDVTASAGVEEFSYSHGMAVGDYDNDGFPDLYVGNIGRNRLFRNQGDGTFADVTELSGAAGDAWTTSCAFADLNADGYPDLYVVNYLSMDSVTRICQDAKGTPRSCKPILLPAAPDNVFINQQDGTFREQTSDLGFDVPEGRGLGIVVAKLGESRQTSAFVANDGEANFLFVASPDAPRDSATYSDQGVVAGIAFDRNGKPQASMGIAAGDANGDGRIDLFVTNFFHEAPTLYLQHQPLLFTDTTRAAGLFDPGFSVLGFGTQFLDADLDGRLDLLVTNGHEGDYRDLGIPFQMPPQFFQNLGNGQFTEVLSDRLGAFFEGKYLGRGLSRIDWNRDGHDDIAISHLDAPVALLTNRTKSAGNFLAVHLRGVQNDRDAIGTTISMSRSSESFSAQLMAGDGYLASNQRRVTLGVGSGSVIEKLLVTWTSGATQTFRNVPANREIVIIEGRDGWHELRHDPTQVQK